MEKLVFASDFHYPYEDKKAVELLKKVMRYLKPDRFIHGGDHWDFWSVSRFQKMGAHRRYSLTEELEQGLEGLKEMRWLAKTADFIEGNHEQRLAKDIASRAPFYEELIEKYHLDLRSLVEKQGFRSYTPYRDFLKIGKVYYTHDLDRIGEYAIHQTAKDAHHSIVIGHTHIMDYMVGGTAVGESKLAASFGWLGDISKVDYMHRLKARRQWALGFGVGYMMPGGLTFWQPVPIVDYACVVEGRLFRIE